ncbi:hypothetical protein B0H10DRAFT_2233565 [Mycena sp. CBHHK59/15]|nr:hypothetical protein B0H10DRAFT_2233565 [Mycena sp. CBHHK59/15]
MSSALPPGPLYGHYSSNQQLYTMHSGSPDVVLNTPSPLKSPVLDSAARVPLFRQLRYLSPHFPYLLFIPKHHPWRNPLFQTLDRPCHSLPIVKDGDEGFCLDPEVAEAWMNLEHCLCALGKEMFALAPPQRWLKRLVNPWFFPGRFKFLRKYRTEQAARSGAWYSIDNFLPLLGYVSMGLWCMQSWESETRSRGEEPPDWRSQVMEKTEVHPMFLDYLENSVNRNEEHVGALYRIQTPTDFVPEQREQRAEIEWLLTSILFSNFPIPIYLSWGNLPKKISMLDVPEAFHEFVPDEKELEYLASPVGEMKFSRWAVNKSFVWYRDPFTPASMSVAAAPLPLTDEPFAPAVPAAPFPPLPKNSRQKPSKTIQAFFIRRKESNMKKIANENSADRQRRTSHTDNAKRGAVPGKASVFLWENQNGYWIRHLQTRGEFADFWSEYPGPQRRFDPIHNEWDLCTLFQNNDPVFGEGYDAEPDDDTDDEMDFVHPTFPQNIDMALRLPREGTNMEVVQEQHPHDLEMVSIEDVPSDEDLGPDFTESDIPKRSLTDASRQCVNLLYIKFGLAPRTEKPEYESIAGNLLDTLERQFGFVMLPSPEEFFACDPPRECFNPQHLANVVSMTDIAHELASQKGLQNTLGTFFGQCMEARSVKDIDRKLLDYHQPQLFVRTRSPFKIGREYLKSMRNPSQHSWYYVLRRIGSGTGSEVLLIPRATDLVEALRQQWGPDIKDVVGHFLTQGIPFWLAYISVEIMPVSEPTPLGLRHKGFKADTSSGLGFRPYQHKFDEHDYKGYTTQRDLQLLHTPHARIALQYGGVIAWLARSQVSDDDFFRGFDDEIYDVGDCLWDERSRHAYWYDRLSDHEIDLLCSVYQVGTGQKKTGGKGKEKEGHGQLGESAQMDTDDQTSIVSWWPKPNAWARGSLDGAWWTPQCETNFFAKRLSHFAKGVYIPQRQSNWRHNLKFKREVKKCWDDVQPVYVVCSIRAIHETYRSPVSTLLDTTTSKVNECRSLVDRVAPKVNHMKRTNVHIVFHLYDFIKLWGPVISWWAFPVERLIGLLQKIESNGRVGGEHEATVLTTWMRGANLRRWLKRPNCPKVLQEFYRLFSLYHGSRLENPDARPGIETKPRKKGLQDGEQAYYDFAGLHFSKAGTHMGNSLVSYLDEGKTWFGSIEKIKVTPQGSVCFAIRHQEHLPPGKNDPFKDFPHFPARTYSSKMAETLVDVAPSKVLGHYAHFNFSDSCAVVLDLRRVNHSTAETVSSVDAVGLCHFQAKPWTRMLTLVACKWLSNRLDTTTSKVNECRSLVDRVAPKVNHSTAETVSSIDAVGLCHFQAKPWTRMLTLVACKWLSNRLDTTTSKVNECRSLVDRVAPKVNHSTAETVSSIDAVGLRHFQAKPWTRMLTLVACKWLSNPLTLPKCQSLGGGSNCF